MGGAATLCLGTQFVFFGSIQQADLRVCVQIFDVYAQKKGIDIASVRCVPRVLPAVLGRCVHERNEANHSRRQAAGSQLVRFCRFLFEGANIAPDSTVGEVRFPSELRMCGGV